MASSTFWWCLSIRGGKDILGMVLWCSGILLNALPCMIVILGGMDGFCSVDVIGGNQTVYDLVLLDGLF